MSVTSSTSPASSSPAPARAEPRLPRPGARPAGLTIGPHHLPAPVVLAPMAGITNRAFRRLCREFDVAAGAPAGRPGGDGHDATGGNRTLASDGALGGSRPADGPGAPGANRAHASEVASHPGGAPQHPAPRASGASCLYVSEMITSRALVERSPETMRLIEHDPDEPTRSVQLYGVDPATVGAAARLLVEEDRADHIDLNFGCPVPKVTRKGGGAALPWKLDLFRGIVAAAVAAAAPRNVPVTVKMRLGIDDDHITFLDAGRIAEAEGAAAVALHARTASQAYSGRADRARIAALKEAVTSIPVLGNGDIWSAQDALDMVRETGCDGVVVGRGCLGRPWLFADLAAAFAGSDARVRPDLGTVAATLRRHTVYLAEFYADEAKACRDIRKHIAWYLKGFPAGSDVRHRLALVEDLASLDALLGDLDPTQPWPGDAAEGQRGRAGSPRRVALPEGWLDSRDLTGESARMIAAAELSVSGG